MGDDEIVGRIMDKATVADRRALFAALQAAIGEITDLTFGRSIADGSYSRIEEALDVGAPYGSPEHLAYIEAKAAQHG